MARFGFVGPTYTSQSIIADSQRTMNWYPEMIESGQGQSQMALYRTPGLKLLVTLPTGPVRGCLPVTSGPGGGTSFWVGGGILYQVSAAGVATAIGPVGNDFKLVSMATNGSGGNQLCICSAGEIYIYNLSATQPTGNIGLAPNTLSGTMGGLQGFAAKVRFCDGYFVVILANTNKFQVSSLEDGTVWNPLSVQQVEVFPENIAGIEVAYRQLWILGANGHGQVYYNSGANQYTPFDVIGAGGVGFMEEGINAPDSLAVLDNAPFWIGGNENGGGIAWRANGYTPLRISNHAIEAAWARYPQKSSDAIGYSYRDQGHTFWVLRFPSANDGNGATWVYDTATQMWHERGFWSQKGFTGYSAHLSTCHCFAFDMHLVGDWSSGNIYLMDIAYLDDNGAPLRRARRAPHIASERQWITFHELEVVMDVGDGPIPPLLDGAGNPRGPQAMLHWSNDGGRTWGNEHWVDTGQAGEYTRRARWLRMGRARDRVFELVVTDPAPWQIIEADLRATPGFDVPTERLSKMYGKMT
jgi:hypothetical protein